MTTEEATKIEVEVWEKDQVVVHFDWDRRGWHQPVRVDSRDGRAVLWLDREDARELQRQLGEALNKQDFADAGHPDPEDVQVAADVRREAVENR